ncbi:MAG: response regulator [Chlorobi bacterium]|nr:response regulator [Chlorobiota bacterium]
MEKKILVIEDDPFTKIFYKKILSDKLGYKIDILEDGDKILEAVAVENYVLIILDINLINSYLDGKKTDGVQISKAIKTKFPDRNIPILLITAYKKGNKTDNFFVQSLADDYIIKPIADFNILLDKVTQLIEDNG